MTSTKRILVLSAGAISFLLVVGFGFWQLFHERVETAISTAIDDYLRGRVETEAFRQSEGRLRVEIGKLDYGFFSGELTISQATVRIYDSTKHVQLSIVIDSTNVVGLYPWDILRENGLSIGSVDVHGVRVRRVVDETIVPLNLREDPPGDLSTSKSKVVLRENSPGELDTPTSKMILREKPPGESDRERLKLHEQKADSSSVPLQLPQLPSADSILSALAATILPTEVVPLNIERVSIDAISWIDVRRSDSVETSRIDGGRFTITSIAVDTDTTTPLIGDVSVHVASLTRLLRPDTFVHAVNIGLSSEQSDSSLTFSHVQYIVDSLISYKARDVAFAYKQHRLTVGSFHMHPIHDDVEHIRRIPRGSDRIELFGKRLVLDGIDLTSLTQGTAIHADVITVGSASIDILSDKRPKERRLRQQPPPQLWRLIRQLPFRLDVGAIRMRDVGIKYSEWTISPLQTATLVWSKGEYTITGVTTDTTSSILDVRGTTQFLRSALLDAHIRIDLRPRRHELTATGTAKNLDCRDLNTFLIEAERIRVTSGHCSIATFDIAVSGRTSRGSVHPDYTDLNLELLRKDKTSGLFSGIASFLANWLVVRNDNTGSEARRGLTSMKLPQDAALMQTIWFPLRKGILEVVK